MKNNNIKYIAFPIPLKLHTRFKTIASAQNKSFRGLFLEAMNEYLEQDVNRKIFSEIKNNEHII